jgi:hypothetical protein
MLRIPWTLQLNASAKAIPRRVSYRTNPELSNNALCAPPGSPKSLGRTRSDPLKDQPTGPPGIPCPSILIDLTPVEWAPVVTRGPHVTPGPRLFQAPLTPGLAPIPSASRAPPGGPGWPRAGQMAARFCDLDSGLQTRKRPGGGGQPGGRCDMGARFCPGRGARRCATSGPGHAPGIKKARRKGRPFQGFGLRFWGKARRPWSQSRMTPPTR